MEKIDGKGDEKEKTKKVNMENRRERKESWKEENEDDDRSMKKASLISKVDGKTERNRRWRK